MSLSVKNTGTPFASISTKTQAILRNCAVSVLIVVASLLLTLSNYYYKSLLLFFGLFLAFAILYFTLAFYFLLPKSLVSKKPLLSSLIRFVITLTLAFIPSILLFLLFIRNLETSITFAVLNSIFQLFVTMPLSWYWYKRQVKDGETILGLQKELGQSSASLDFLRSQINPHFLFNALNTIYGTALQERAERTSEGIERLANMMRFMLQENLHEQIALSKELDYLRSYIELQKLRTATHDCISIKTNIPDSVEPCNIAPMLLIPFLENAFKHGISFRDPSYIKLSVEINNNTLQFQLANSIHEQKHFDPEKNNTGIGLNNVKERLNLLYPKKHELVVRDTGKEFFIDLQIHLD